MGMIYADIMPGFYDSFNRDVSSKSMDPEQDPYGTTLQGLQQYGQSTLAKASLIQPAPAYPGQTSFLA